jgi:hypothetical protein
VSKKVSDKFNFFVETDIHKGKNSSGEEVVWIDGIASSSSVADSDNETLFPIGMNTVPLIQSGLVNYNHQGNKDSNANVGIPVEAKVINGGRDLYVKCMLFPCPQTDGIVRMYDNFKKYSPTRKVGFSIEGKATKRDIFDSKKILEADVTGLAVTFSPKNKNTLMNIIKGEYETPYIDLNEDEEEEDELEKMDTLAIAPMVPESVEHDPKDISNKNNKKKVGQLINKSDIYISISNKYPTATIAEVKNIYSFIVETQNKLFSDYGK